MTNSKYIIIGAGLSGLTTGLMLSQKGILDFLILESRSQIGGRILTENGIDLGATWFQNYHEQIHKLLDSLKIDKFHQYTQGKGILIYNHTMPAHYFEPDPNAAPAFRVEGGSQQLIESLAASIQEYIKCDVGVQVIEEMVNGIRLQTTAGIYEAEKVIVTLPPKLAGQLTYIPNLPESILRVMDQTHTWMSNAIKMGLVFEKPFWRERALSGTLIGQVAPVTELYDHSSTDGKTVALMGFINEGLRHFEIEQRKQLIVQFLAAHLGDPIYNHLTYTEKDWSLDEHTSTKNVGSRFDAVRYGDPVFQQEYMNRKLLFSGTETAIQYGGYMEGAVGRGMDVVEKLLKSE